MDTSICAVCGAPIAQKPTGRPRLTCSDACRKQREREAHGVMTLYFLAPTYDAESQTFVMRWYRPTPDSSSGIVASMTAGEGGEDILRFIPAPPPATRSREHVQAIDLIDEYLQGRLAQMDAEHPERSNEVRGVVAKALVPWVRRLARGQNADMADLFGLARLLDRIAPLPGFNEVSA